MGKEKTVSNVQMKIWNLGFTCVFISYLAMSVGQKLVNPLISRYTNYLGGSATIIGLVSSSFAIVALACKIFSGPVIDTFKKKSVLIFALVVMCISYAGYAISTSATEMLVFRMIQGLGQAFTSTCFTVAATQTLPKEKLSAGMGVFWTAQSIPQLFGAALGVQLADMVGYHFAFGLGAGLMLLAVIITCFMKIDSGEPHEKKKVEIKLSNIITKDALLPASFIGILYLGYCSIGSFLIVFCDEQHIAGNAGLHTTAYAVALLVARPFIGKMVDRFGFVKVTIINVILCIVTFFMISAASNIWIIILAGAVVAFGFGATQPTIQALAMKCCKSDKRGAASSTNYIGQDLGSLFGPLIAGVVADTFGYVNMWRIMTIPFFIVLVLLFLSHRKIGKLESDFVAEKVEK